MASIIGYGRMLFYSDPKNQPIIFEYGDALIITIEAQPLTAA